MSFILRAGLVIGALSYLAATRGDPAPAPHASVPVRPEAAAVVAQAWHALPVPARDAAMREGVALLARHATAPTSRDTLAEVDRHPSWRGP